jgi:hypothetical protein
VPAEDKNSVRALSESVSNIWLAGELKLDCAELRIRPVTRLTMRTVI